jgi:HK97 family phage major capsid protein
MAQTAYSRQFLIQSSLDVEAMLREDLALIFAIGFDTAAMIGTGASNQPKGIINQSGVNTVAIGTNGGGLTYGFIVSAQTALEVANVPITMPGMAATPGTKGWLRNHAKLANTVGLPIWADDNTVGGWAAKSTMSLPQNGTKGTGINLHTAIFGAWNNLVLAEWGALELIADPYTQAGKGNVVLTGMMLVDVAVRYAQAFTVISDIDNTVP